MSFPSRYKPYKLPIITGDSLEIVLSFVPRVILFFDWTPYVSPEIVPPVIVPSVVDIIPTPYFELIVPSLIDILFVDIPYVAPLTVPPFIVAAVEAIPIPSDELITPFVIVTLLTSRPFVTPVIVPPCISADVAEAPIPSDVIVPSISVKLDTLTPWPAPITSPLFIVRELVVIAVVDVLSTFPPFRVADADPVIVAAFVDFNSAPLIVTVP